MTPKNEVEKRMSELMKPIEMQIQMTDDRQELVLFAMNMAIAAKRILFQRMGEKDATDFLEKILKDTSIK